MILGPEDLPGAKWILINERMHPTGSKGTGKIAERALEAGGSSIWREFTRGSGLSFWVQVDPLATEEDATFTVKSAPNWAKKNVNFDGEVVDEMVFEGESLPGVTSIQRKEQRTTRSGTPQACTYLFGNVESIFFALGGTLTWDAMNEIAVLQAAKIQRGWIASS